MVLSNGVEEGVLTRMEGSAILSNVTWLKLVRPEPQEFSSTYYFLVLGSSTVG